MTSKVNRNGRWLVILAGPARKSLESIPPKDRVRVQAAIENLEADPFQGDVRKLAGDRHGFRRRVGAFRIFYDVYPAERTVIVTAVPRRTSVTY